MYSNSMEIASCGHDWLQDSWFVSNGSAMYQFHYCFSKNTTTTRSKRKYIWQFLCRVLPVCLKCPNHWGLSEAPRAPGVGTSYFPGRNGKCKISPDLLGTEKDITGIVMCGGYRHTIGKLTFTLFQCYLIQPAVVQTRRVGSALSEWIHGIHVLCSQKRLIACSNFDFLETLGGVLEEEVLSWIWFKHVKGAIGVAGT